MSDRKAVIERRVEMATQCECLAAWDNTRECICAKRIEFEVDPDALATANRVIWRLNELEQQIAKVAAGPDPVVVQVRKVVEFTLPKALVMAALGERRAALVRELSDTGVISVNSAKIRTVLK